MSPAVAATSCSPTSRSAGSRLRKKLRRPSAGWRSTRRRPRPARSSTSMEQAMFANALLTALALAGQQIVIPIGNPPQVERAKAPLQTAGPAWVASCQGSDDWDRPAPPVRIHGNTYMVGTCGISAILIAGSDGHVLIDGGTERGAELIAANIRALGFKLSDVRILLH